MKTSLVHKFISFAFATVVLIYNFKSVPTLANFVINQDAIAKTLCVQKEDQQGCNGKCQLVIALKKDMKQQQEFPLQNIEKIAYAFHYFEPLENTSLYKFSEDLNLTIFDGALYNTINKSYIITTPPPLFC